MAKTILALGKLLQVALPWSSHAVTCCSKDVLHEDRVHGDPEEADLSNFLHPVLYYYSTSPKPGTPAVEPPTIGHP